jgi:hypothetical protein
VEIGTRYQSRLPGFQVDRAKLDSHMLELACRLGCDLWRPAKVTGFELNDGNGQTVNAVVDGEERTAACRELYDGFVPDRRLRKQISRGLRRWLKCELINLALMLRRPVIRADQRPAGIYTQVSTTTASAGAGSSALS